jgi:hypothetical protein
VNLPRSPIVLACQTTNERPHLLRDRRPPRAALRDGPPVEPEALAVPRTTVSGLTMTRASFQRGQNRDSATQRARSSGVSRGFDRFWAYVTSCWRRASSTIACSPRLRKKAGTQRRRSIAKLGRARMARETLHDSRARYESEPGVSSGVPSVVGSAGPGKKPSNSGADRY